ncbi:MAG: hypothetical protein NNA23_03030, partial [Nitrospira sp.]|nr:hypothetical protein [Nitrospira sp.]
MTATMTMIMRAKRNILKVFGLTTGVVALLQAPAWALPIVFNLGYGGTVSYGGGASAFTTTNGEVRS